MTTTEPMSGVSEAVWTRAVDLLRGPGEVVLVCHVNPDGDALGSMLAVALAMSRLGRQVCCSFDAEPLVLPRNYRFLPGQELLTKPAELPAAPDVLMTFDTSSVDRLAALGSLVPTAGTVVVVDHHARGDGFGDVRVVDPAVPATAVLVSELVHRLGVPLDKEIAACIYTGLTTDTGSFKFAGTTPGVHRLAAKLLETGVRQDLVAREVWDTNSFAYLQLLAQVLERAALEPAAAGGRGLVWTYVTAQELADRDLAVEDIEGLIDVLRTTAEADVAAICKGDPAGGFKVSTRSRGETDVGAVCERLGGGGHRFAAGYTSRADLETTLARLRETLSAT